MLETKNITGIAILAALVISLIVLTLAILKVEFETTKLEATLLAQGVGANSIRCALNKDATSCALATHESLPSAAPQQEQLP